MNSARMMRGPLPIVVGVTGHRDVQADALPALQARIAEIFDELLDAYRNTPLLLLSPLAAGADRIVARVAMEARFAIPVIVPMPFETAEYEKDFDAAELAEFRTLLKDVHCSYFVGYAPGNDAVKVAPKGPARDLQYAQVGSYIARNSQVLLALWNGKESDAVGGTAQVVRFKLEGIAPPFGPERRSIDPPDVGPVRHIVTPRDDADAARLGSQAYRSVLLRPVRAAAPAADAPHERAGQVAGATYGNVDLFNHRAVRAGVTVQQLSAETLRRTADTLALRYRDRTGLTIKVLFGLALFTALTFELFAHVPGHPSWAVAIDLALSALGLGCYFIAREGRWQDSFQDYRAIAEALRIQGQWQDAGIDDTVAEHYLQQHRGELDWIRNTVRTCRILDETARPAPGAPLAERFATLATSCSAWIGGDAPGEGQIGFFESRIARSKRRERAVTRLTGTALGISVGLTILGFIAAAAPESMPGRVLHDSEWRWAVLIIAIALTAVLAALAKGYANFRAYTEQRKQYERMLGVFCYAKVQLAAIYARGPSTDEDYEAARKIVVELGQEALGENTAWVMLHRERQLEYPRG